MSSRAPAIGIDLGNSYSCVGVFRNNKVEIIANEHGNRITPSYVAFTDTKRFIGDSAKNQIASNSENTLFDAKRLIGRRMVEASVQKDMEDWPFYLIKSSHRKKPTFTADFKCIQQRLVPEEVSSMVLFKMKEIAEAYLGQSVTDAVITVPAYFNDLQRQLTKDAATIAGLNVLQIINEPTAAAITYSMTKRTEDKRNVLIFDLGGATLDVSILTIEDGEIEVKGVGSHSHLGGEDFDNRLVAYLIKEFKRENDLSAYNYICKDTMSRLRIASERAKQTLSFNNEARIELESFYEDSDFHSTISRARFEELNFDLFQQVINTVRRALESANLWKVDIDEIVLVGGSSRIPKIQKMLHHFFKGKELYTSINPDEAVAYGAAVQAAILSGDKSETLQHLKVQDMAMFHISIKMAEGEKVVIRRKTPIPWKEVMTFSTCSDYQPGALIQIYEGNQKEVWKKKQLKNFVLVGTDSMCRGEPLIELTFEMDASGILDVSVVEKNFEKVKIIDLKEECHRHSKNDIERLVKKSRHLHDVEMKPSTSDERKKCFTSCDFDKKVIDENDERKKSLTSCDFDKKVIDENDERKKSLTSCDFDKKVIDENDERKKNLTSCDFDKKVIDENDERKKNLTSCDFDEKVIDENDERKKSLTSCDFDEKLIDENDGRKKSLTSCDFDEKVIDENEERKKSLTSCDFDKKITEGCSEQLSCDFLVTEIKETSENHEQKFAMNGGGGGGPALDLEKYLAQMWLSFDD